MTDRQRWATKTGLILALAGVTREGALPGPLAFDHERVLREYFRYRATGQRPGPD